MSEKKITVESNETFWSIAQRELGDPQRWIDIFVKNHRDLAKRVYVRAGTELEMPEPGFDPSANFDPSGN
jgi:nucleoid-associated protein YgaU